MGAAGVADKNQSWALLREHVSLANRQLSLSRQTFSWKIWTVFLTACLQLLQSGPQSASNIESTQRCGAMKMVKSHN